MYINNYSLTENLGRTPYWLSI